VREATTQILQTKGLSRLALERPDLLIEMLNENFFSPPQICLSIDALIAVINDDDALAYILPPLLSKGFPAVTEKIIGILQSLQPLEPI
jgi:hypothetical protein